MNKTKADQFVRKRADELRNLSRVLLDSGLIRDPEPLLRAAANCRGYQTDGLFRWEYEMSGLEFPDIELRMSDLRHTRPRTTSTVSLRLDAVVRGTCLDEGACEDPFNHLVVDLFADGLTDDGEHLTCAWHLDRHPIQNPAQSAPSDQAANAHPHYHFQYGGRAVWAKDDSEFGTHLLLEPPRLAHPPLDAVLAIDFVLSNYFGSAWGELRRENASYNMLLRDAQDRLWRPYAVALARHWLRESDSVWDPCNIWPQLHIASQEEF